MDLRTIMQRFPTQESCIEHLEKIRWGNAPVCPRCGAINVARKTIKERKGEWNCHGCKSTFNVLTNTMFQGTKIDLQIWFLAISLIHNAKKSLSSHQLARDLNLTQQTALYMQERIRMEMVRKTTPTLLRGIIEMDETYIGGKPRKGNRKKDDPTNKRGRGTNKTPVLGAVERGGNVQARVSTKVRSRDILDFLKDLVRFDESVLMTDEFKAYKPVGEQITHKIVNHSEQYVDGDVHVNTIEGFWALLKRAWYGSHHHYKFVPLYVAEAVYKYNNRNKENTFETFLNQCFA